MFMAFHGHSRSKKELLIIAVKLLIIAVKLLIIAVKKKNFWLIPGQFLVIPVKKMKVILTIYLRLSFSEASLW